MSSPSSRYADVRLHVVSGKGGTGKSTVAAALALALASEGRNVLLCEVEGRQGIARMFDVDPLPYAETRIATGLTVAPATPQTATPEARPAPPGNVYALHIDAEEALVEYLAMYYKLGRAGKALDKFGVIGFATTVAPGVRDVLLTGKVFEAVERSSRNKHARRYDAVVLDAPPTGRITDFLNVSDQVAGLAKVGPIKTQADTMMTLFRSPRTAVHLVTLLEEMPVQETLDGVAQLRDAHLPVGSIVVNQVRSHGDTAHLQPSTAAEIGRDLASVRLPDDVDGDTLAQALHLTATEYAERSQLEQTERERLTAAGVHTVELPRSSGPVDLGGLYDLAARIRDHLAAPATPTDPEPTA